MSKDIEINDFAVIDGVDPPMYLGSPSVVTEIVQDYVNQVYEWVKARGDGSMTAPEMSVKLRKLVEDSADIIMGRNSLYKGIIGYHNRYALGMAIRQVLGVFWDKYKGSYNDDPGQALFRWLAATLVDSVLIRLSHTSTRYSGA
jgi:hypothetical protein